MTQFKGITIKKIVKFKGHEGEELFQCDIYYKNKKLAFFSQDSWGGCYRIDFYDYENPIINEKQLNELAKSFIPYAKEHNIKVDKLYEKYSDMFDIESLLTTLLEFKEYERFFKAHKDNYKYVGVLRNENGWQESLYAVKDLKSLEDLAKAREMTIFYIFKDLNDFEMI